ncbi:hypothetical protein LT350_06110 [Mycolicibacterium smegmatis]|uniref:hypothetical protein n=1 Tax=Mycolicibacterium smegmatis TaxID=1772 RepID=UPI001E2D0A1F|nr:hypothetical protein [Mycolicibacterium smegmatis]UGU32513.1 hypothetical protein LT350_06110 [Mycolicibacterium smegmatis]
MPATSGAQKPVKKILAGVLVMTGIGGAGLLSTPTNREAAVAVEQQPALEAAVAPVVAPAPAPVVAPPPVAAVTKDSDAQAIVRAIVAQGQAAGLSEDQIKTIIATAKIESGFRPAVSGGVQAYGSRGTRADEVIGLFQEKASFGTVEERQDPNKAIARFIVRFNDAFRKYGTSDNVLAATLAQNPQLRKYRSGGVGTHYYNTVRAAMGAAADLYHQATGATL